MLPSCSEGVRRQTPGMWNADSWNVVGVVFSPGPKRESILVQTGNISRSKRGIY